MTEIPPRVFSGYNDDESWFPLFATAEAAKEYAERQYRHDFPEYDDTLAWRERKARTELVGYPDMWELDGTGYVVCGLPVYADVQTAWRSGRHCDTCGGPIEWIECPTGGWWKHALHPEDGHDAVGPEAVSVYA